MSPRSLLLLAGLCAGCSLFKFNIDTPAKRREAEEARQSEARAAEEEARVAARREAEAAAAREEATIRELDGLRAEIRAGCEDVSKPCTAEVGAVGAKALRFAELVVSVREGAAEREGRINVGALKLEAVGYLEQALASPSYALFIAMASVADTPETDAAVQRACAKVRPVVAKEAVAEFVALCLARAGGDAKQLQWPGVKADLVTLRAAQEAEARAEAEATRARAEAARAQAEADRAAAEQDKLAAKSAQAGAARAIAAVFAAGRCNFGNCLKDGWIAETEAGEVRVACNFGNCLKDGWTARLPDGSEARTTCSFGDCMKDGWETRYSDGSSVRTTCRFQKCATEGWDTQLPGGGSARTSCNFGDCFKDGWTTQLPGGSVRCTCNFQKCLTDGTRCQ